MNHTESTDDRPAIAPTDNDTLPADAPEAPLSEPSTDPVDAAEAPSPSTTDEYEPNPDSGCEASPDPAPEDIIEDLDTRLPSIDRIGAAALAFVESLTDDRMDTDNLPSREPPDLVSEIEVETEEASEDDDSDDDDSTSDDDTVPEVEIPEGRLSEYVTDRTFRDFPLSEELLRGILDHDYNVATAVQAASIEPGLAGRDLVVRAKTGTGKTAAYLIPVLDRVQDGGHFPQAIILAPTRELALQVTGEAMIIGRYKDLRVCTLYGGVPIGPQTDALREGVDIVVGTPGRINDHLRRGNLDLSRCVIAVLDEADEMLSMGFLEDVSYVLNRISKEHQMLLFSATVGAQITTLIGRYMKNPESILLSTDADQVEGIHHALYETHTEVHKARQLLAILDKEEPESAIIFCNTREDASTVASFLARQGLDVELLSGELSQKQREVVMARKKAGEIQFLVATDVAARGIDISDISHVIHYSLPDDPSLYVHRSGRTGRIGKDGRSVALAGGTDLNTRNVLEREHHIIFDALPAPTEEEAARMRVDRQARQLEAAMSTMAFEGFLRTVRVLKERPDGDRLLAVALRAFFLWDRRHQAELAGRTLSENDGQSESPRQGERRDGGRRDGPRDGRRDGPRDGRRDGSRDGRRDGRRDDRRESRRDAPRDDTRRDDTRRDDTRRDGPRPERRDDPRRDGPRPESREGARPESREGARPESREGARPESREGARPAGERNAGQRRRRPRSGGPTESGESGPSEG